MLKLNRFFYPLTVVCAVALLLVYDAVAKPTPSSQMATQMNLSGLQGTDGFCTVLTAATAYDVEDAIKTLTGANLAVTGRRWYRITHADTAQPTVPVCSALNIAGTSIDGCETDNAETKGRIVYGQTSQYLFRADQGGSAPFGNTSPNLFVASPQATRICIDWGY